MQVHFEDKKIIGSGVIANAVVMIFAGAGIIAACVLVGLIERFSDIATLNFSRVIFYINLVILVLFGVSFIVFGISKIKRRAFIFLTDGKLIFGNVQKPILLNEIKSIGTKKRYRFRMLGWLKHDVIEVTFKNGQIKNFVDIANPQRVVTAIEKVIDGV